MTVLNPKSNGNADLLAMPKAVTAPEAAVVEVANALNIAGKIFMALIKLVPPQSRPVSNPI